MAFSLLCTESLPIVQSLTQMPPPPWSFPKPPAGNRPLYFTCARVTLFLWKLLHRRPHVVSPLPNCNPLQGRDQVTFILVQVHMWKEDWTKSPKPLRQPIFMICRQDTFLIWIMGRVHLPGLLLKEVKCGNTLVLYKVLNDRRLLLSLWVWRQPLRRLPILETFT